MDDIKIKIIIGGPSPYIGAVERVISRSLNQHDWDVTTKYSDFTESHKPHARAVGDVEIIFVTNENLVKLSNFKTDVKSK